MAYKKIEGIKPFNELQLKSCFYQQMATAYAYFGVNPKIIAGNYFPFYEFNTEQGKLSLYSCEILDEKELEILTGVQKKQFKKIENLEKFVIKQINRLIPVILLVDCFYLDYREDTYLQKHISHSILIYGYDSDARTFIISEHQHLNSHKYIERIVSMDVIIVAYVNFICRLMQNKLSLITLTKKGKPQGVVVEFFKKGISCRVDNLKKSIEAFQKGIKYICACLLEQKKFDEKKDVLISFIGNVKINKNIQKNIIAYIWGKTEAYNIADRIVDDYIFIYGLIVKMKAMKRYNLQFVKKILERCYELLELESKLHLWFIRGNYE